MFNTTLAEVFSNSDTSALSRSNSFRMLGYFQTDFGTATHAPAIAQRVVNDAAKSAEMINQFFSQLFMNR